MRSMTEGLWKRALWAGLLVPLLALGLSLGASSMTFAQGAALNLTFGPGRDATQAGTVTLTPQGDQTVVVVKMAANPAGTDQLAHIHSGHCPGVGPVVFPFNNLVNGTSTTTINTTLAAVQDGNHSINVHQGTTPPATNIYTACVDIPAASGSAAATTSAGGAAPTATAARPVPTTAAPAATAAVRPAATTAPAAAPVAATARPVVVPARPPNTGVGPGPARPASIPSEAEVAAPATASQQPSAAQVTVSAAPQLPNTGTGGLIEGSVSSTSAALLAAITAFGLLSLGAGLALSRRRA